MALIEIDIYPSKMVIFHSFFYVLPMFTRPGHPTISTGATTDIEDHPSDHLPLLAEFELSEDSCDEKDAMGKGDVWKQNGDHE